MTAKARFRLKGEQRRTLTVQARNQSNVLLPVVSLFHELNVGIDAIYMIRRMDAEKVNIIVTVQMGRENAARVEANLMKVVGVLSVKTEIDRKSVLGESTNAKSTPRSEL